MTFFSQPDGCGTSGRCHAETAAGSASLASCWSSPQKPFRLPLVVRRHSLRVEEGAALGGVRRGGREAGRRGELESNSEAAAAAAVLFCRCCVWRGRESERGRPANERRKRERQLLLRPTTYSSSPYSRVHSKCLRIECHG